MTYIPALAPLRQKAKNKKTKKKKGDNNNNARNEEWIQTIEYASNKHFLRQTNNDEPQWDEIAAFLGKLEPVYEKLKK